MSRNVLLIPAVALLLGLPGCVKSTLKSAISGDNTGTIAMKMSYKAEAIENAKNMIQSMGGDESSSEQVTTAMKELEEHFDEKRMVEKMKAQGIEVTSSKAIEKDGWKGFELEGTIKDVNSWIEKSEKETEKKVAGTPLAGMNLPGGGSTFTPKFFKTQTAGVGEAVLVPALDKVMGAMGGEMPDLDEIGDEERSLIESYMDNIKTQLSVDELNVEITMKLPGTIVSVKGCKKVDDSTIVFNMKGGDITLDGLKSMFGMKDGVSATFNIPEGCKLNFAEAKSQASKTEKAGEEDSEKKEKKGGLKIGEKKNG